MSCVTGSCTTAVAAGVQDTSPSSLCAGQRACDGNANGAASCKKVQGQACVAASECLSAPLRGWDLLRERLHDALQDVRKPERDVHDQRGRQPARQRAGGCVLGHHRLRWRGHLPEGRGPGLRRRQRLRERLLR